MCPDRSKTIQNHPYSRAIFWCIAPIFSFLVNSSVFADQLYQNFARISQSYYKEAAAELRNTHFIKNDINALRKQVARLLTADDETLATATILANEPLLLKNIDSDHTAYFLGQLLKHDVWISSERIANYALQNGNGYTQSRVNYQLANYYFERGNTERTFKHLTSIESSEALTEKERDYATLIFGIALQQSKKHREAMKVYAKLKRDSFYYSYAQLNTAIANIRQGWWTDAHLAIESALEVTPPDELKETYNRLLVVLAYSQLQNEFFRNARLTLRKISLDSEYVNRALLGIGLCAVHQKDYPGALNAFMRLQQHTGDDLSVMESYVMVPFTRERMGEQEEAAQRYAEAIAYFENKKRFYDHYLSELKAAEKKSFTPLELAHVNKSLTQRYAVVNGFDDARSSASVRQDILSMRRQLKSLIADELGQATQTKITNIQSYLSQSQYGLAKLYDSQ